MNNFDRLSTISNNDNDDKNKLIEFFIDIPPFIAMYKQRNDIENNVLIKDILDHWNEELKNEFSGFKFIDIEQVGADEDNGKFIIALSSKIESTQEKEILPKIIMVILNWMHMSFLRQFLRLVILVEKIYFLYYSKKLKKFVKQVKTIGV